MNTALNERHLKEIYREEEGMSEKAKGKLPDNTASLNSSSSQLPSSYESLAHFSGGKDDFVPTNEWVHKNKKSKKKINRKLINTYIG